MTETWLVEILKLLFGQIGAVGTICVVAATYIGWQLHLSQQEKKNLLLQFDQVQEKRIELLQQYLKTLGEFKGSIDSMVVLLTSKNRSNGT